MPEFQKIDPAADYGAQEAANLKGVNRVTVYNAIRSGRLPARKTGTGYRVVGAALLAWKPGRWPQRRPAKPPVLREW